MCRKILEWQNLPHPFPHFVALAIPAGLQCECLICLCFSTRFVSCVHMRMLLRAPCAIFICARFAWLITHVPFKEISPDCVIALMLFASLN